MQSNEVQFIEDKLVLHSSWYIFLINSASYEFYLLQNLKKSPETEKKKLLNNCFLLKKQKQIYYQFPHYFIPFKNSQLKKKPLQRYIHFVTERIVRNTKTTRRLEIKRWHTSAILVAHIWKSPHIPKSNDGTSSRQNELCFACPFATLLDCLWSAL